MIIDPPEIIGQAPIRDIVAGFCEVSLHLPLRFKQDVLIPGAHIPHTLAVERKILPIR